MGFLIKTVFFCALLTFFVSFYSEDIVRFVGEGARQTEQSTSKNSRKSANIVHELEIPVKQDGHYWIDMNVNHQKVNFIVDTGASYVTLAYRDAQNLNLQLFENDFNRVVNTASGQTTMAAVTLDVISADAIEIYEVKALVAREGMLSVSLLGMNYLSKLDRFEFRDQTLILEQ